MKCSEPFRLLLNDGWIPVSQKGSHVKMRHKKKTGVIVFPTMDLRKLERDWQQKF